MTNSNSPHHVDEILAAKSIKSIHLAHRRAVRRVHRENNDDNDDGSFSTTRLISPLNAARDNALAKLQQQQQQEIGDGGDSMMQAQEIYPQIYLGPFSVARNALALTRLGITHIVCLSAEGPTVPPALSHNDDNDNYTISYISHPLVEVECTLENGAQQLVAVLPSCLCFVQEALSSSSKKPNGGGDDSEHTDHTNTTVLDQHNHKNNRHTVLIHCLHGKTRSAAIAACIVAVLSAHGDFGRAYEQITNCRNVLVPEEWHDELQRGVDAQMLRCSDAQN
jgi:hypothetical protein